MPDNKDPLGTTLYGKTNWPRTKRSDILKQYPGLEYVSGEWGNDKYKYKLPSGEYAYYGITKTGEDLDPYQFGPISSPVVAKAPSVKATAAPVEQIVKQPTVINPISNEPQKQSINFASPYGYSDPNTGKAYSYDASYKEKEITPDVQNYRYGGLIKKVRGYAEGGTTKWGGTVDPKTGEVVGAGSGQMNSATGSGIDIASQVAGIGGDYMQSKAMNEDGTVDVGLATGSKALTMGAKGASMGMAFGPYGALIGAGVGGLAGAGIGYFGAKNVNDEIDIAKDKAAQDKLAAAATEKYQSNMAKQMLERQQGFKDGGEIKGGLLPKSKTVDRFDPKNYGNKPMLSEEELNKVMLNDMKWETEGFYKIPPKGGSVINKDVISYDKYGNKTLSEPWYSADVEPTKTIPDSVLRAAPTYANGGEIKGKGGPKDDKISAKVKAGSFVVPAENKEAAKQVKKMIAPSKKKEVANLDQEDGTEVKLSDGEFLFSPEEKEEIINELGEHFLEALAPNAEHESEEMREGGLTPGKAKKMLKDGTANGQPLTEKQRGYFGLIASGYKCGGMVKKMATGGNVEFAEDNESGMNGYAEGGVVKKKGQKGTYRGRQVTYDGKNWVTADGSIKYSGDVLDDVLKKEAEKIAKEEKVYQGQKTDMLKRHYESIKDDPERKAEADKLYKQLNPSKGVDKTIPSNTGANIEKALGTGVKVAKGKVSPDVLSKQQAPELITEVKETEILPTENIEDKVKILPKDYSKRNEALTKGLGIAGTQLQGLGNYFLPFQQYKMGQKFLAESGERPKGQIDPDFQRTINNAQANAQFGYTPEEQALLDSKNINALRAGQNAAKNYAGGSAGNAFSMTRQAAGDYYSRGLQAAIGNKQLKMDKQAYADELQKSKAAMNRNLFLDNLNAWQQEQQAGGNLVGAGLQNLIGSQRYNQEMQFNRELAANSNPYAQYRTNPING